MNEQSQTIFYFLYRKELMRSSSALIRTPVLARPYTKQDRGPTCPNGDNEIENWGRGYIQPENIGYVWTKNIVVVELMDTFIYKILLWLNCG